MLLKFTSLQCIIKKSMLASIYNYIYNTEFLKAYIVLKNMFTSTEIIDFI